MKTILSVIGARPQFIKHAPMQLQLSKHFNALTVHTGQHYDKNMSDVFFNDLQIPAPDFLLNLDGAKRQGEQTGVMMAKIEQVCDQVKPNAVLVYGDTNSTLAATLVSIKSHIPLIHIEAGLRSYNRQMPEEVNRIVADEFADLLFCPTQHAIDNLKKEGIDHSGIYLSGDVMCDMLTLIKPSIKPLYEGSYYFATLHRPYNTDDKERLTLLLNTFNGLDRKVIFPIHPRTRSRMLEFGLNPDSFANISFIDPVGYVESVSYQSFADCIITDSGGVQKEAYMLQKKCITMRPETEWVETLANGWNTLLFDQIEELPEVLKVSPRAYMANLYGNGHAAEEITGIIADRTYGKTGN